MHYKTRRDPASFLRVEVGNLPAVVPEARRSRSKLGSVVANYSKGDAGRRRERPGFRGFIAHFTDGHLKAPASGRRVLRRDVNHLLHARIVVGD